MNVSSAPLRFLDAKGEWRDIDLSLAGDGAGGLRTVASPVPVRLSSGGVPSAGVELAGGRAVSFSLAGSQPVEPVGVDGGVRYDQVLPGVDMEVAPTDSGLKDTLVLASAGAAQAFDFPLTLSAGLKPVIEPSGDVVVVNEAGEEQARLPKGSMVDSAAAGGVESSGVSYGLVGGDSSWTVRVVLDGAWLDDPGRVWPVRVDPPITSVWRTEGDDTYVQAGSTSNHSTETELRVGTYGTSSTLAASYLHFDAATAPIAGARIFGATLQAYTSYSSSCVPKTVELHRVTQAWGGTTMSSYPGATFDPAVESAVTYSAGYTGCAGPAWKNWDVTGLVAKWASREVPNYGVTLRVPAGDANSPQSYKKMNSSNFSSGQPQLSVTYSPYYATYSDPVWLEMPSPSKAGKLRVTVTNLGASTWPAGGEYRSSYHIQGCGTPACYNGERTYMPQAVPPGTSITLDAIIALDAAHGVPAPGVYQVELDMVRDGYAWFSDQGSPGILITVASNETPVVTAVTPPYDGSMVTSRTPLLALTANDPDFWPQPPNLQYQFMICADPAVPATCQTSPWVVTGSWTPAALEWKKTYAWKAWVRDGDPATTGRQVETGWASLLTEVPQPAAGGHQGADTFAGSADGVSPNTRGFSTAVTDATVTTIGPALGVNRTYNSTDAAPHMFGTGWANAYDARADVVPDGTGDVIVRNGDGSLRRYGRSGPGVYAAGPGNASTLRGGPTGLVLTDQSRMAFSFNGFGQLSSIRNADGHDLALGYANPTVNALWEYVAGGDRIVGAGDPPGGTPVRVAGAVFASGAGRTSLFSCSGADSYLTTTAGCQAGYAIAAIGYVATAPEAGAVQFFTCTAGNGERTASTSCRPGETATSLGWVPDPAAQRGRLLTATDAASGRKLSFGWTGEHVTSVTTDGVAENGGNPYVWGYQYTGDQLVKVCDPRPGVPCATYRYASGSSYSANVVADDPIGYWPLGSPDAQNADLSTSERPLTLTGAGTTPGPLQQTGDQALLLNGTSSYADLGDGYDDFSTGLTLEAWVRSSDLGSYGHIFDLGNGAKVDSIELYRPGPNANLAFTTTRGNGSPVQSMVANNVFTNTDWHHYVVAVGTDGLGHLYVDGKEVAAGAMWLPGRVTRTSNLLGKSNTPGVPLWKGAVDEAAVYDHALTAADVTAYYQAGRGPTPPQRQLLDQITLPRGNNAFTLTYDRAGRVQTMANGETKAWRYAVASQGSGSTRTAALTRTDPRTYTTKTSIDSHGRVTARTDEATKTTSYGYDERGFLAKVTDPLGHTVAMSSDDRGNILSRTVWRTTTEPLITTYRYVAGADTDPRTDKLAAVRDARSISYPPSVLAGAPTAYWRLGDPAGAAAKDATGHGYAGTYDGSANPIAPSGLATDPDKALSVDGATGTVTIPDNPALRLDRTSAYTLSAWVKTTSTGDGAVVSKMANDACGCAGYEVRVTNGQVMALQIANWGQGNAVNIGGTRKVNDGAWHQIAVTADGTGNANGMNLYVDGQLDVKTVSVNNLTGSSLSPVPVTIGSRQGVLGFLGSIDEVAVYPSALAGTAVAALYSAGTTYDNRFATTFDYDINGRLITRGLPPTPEAPTGRQETWTYTPPGGTEPAGLVKTMRTPAQRTTTMGYTPAGDLLSTTLPTGLVTTYRYDTLGRQTSSTETSDTYPAGVTSSATLNALGDATSVLGPSMTDAVTNQSHQRRDQPSWDYNGNLAGVTSSDLAAGGDPSRTTSFGYDAADRRTSIATPAGTTSWTYDNNGNPETTTAPGGAHITYKWWPTNRLQQTTLDNQADDPTKPSVTRAVNLGQWSYDDAGRLLQTSDPRGNVTAYDYYDDGLPKSTTALSFRDPDNPSSARNITLGSSSYDPVGNVTLQSNGGGLTATSSTYDAADRPTAVDIVGTPRHVGYTYDTDDNITVMTQGTAPSTLTTTNRYDSAGRLDRVTGSDPTDITTYAYDQRGLQTSSTSPRGNQLGATASAYTTSYAHDQLGRTTTVTAPPVAVTRYGQPTVQARPQATTGYNAFGDTVHERDANLNVVTTDFDTAGRPTTVHAPAYTPPGAAPLLPTRSVAYNAAGNIDTLTDATQRITTNRWDTMGRLVARVDPAVGTQERGVTTYGWDDNGNVTSRTSPGGVQQTATFDDLNRAHTTTTIIRDPVGNQASTTKYGHDDLGRPVRTTEPMGGTTDLAYWPDSQVRTRIDQAQKTWTQNYDTFGRPSYAVDPLGRINATSYDAAGRPNQQIRKAANGTVLQTTSATYDPDGNLATAKDPAETIITYDNDALGRLTTVRQPTGGANPHLITTTQGYDAAGQLTAKTDGRVNTTNATWNTLGLIEQVIEPSTAAHPNLADRTWTSSYDARGLSTRLTAPGGVTQDFTYDELGRLTTQTGNGAEAPTAARSFTYDADDRTKTLSTPAGAQSFTWDDLGNLKTSTGPEGAITAAYDLNGRLTSRTDLAGTASFTWDPRSLLKTLTDFTGTRTNSYDDAGRPATTTYGSTSTRTYTFDDLDRPTSDTVTTAGLTKAQLAWTYDANGNTKTKTVGPQGVAGAGPNSYSYDLAKRLTSWTGPGKPPVAYNYDDAGNRTQNGTATATYDQRNRLSTTSTGGNYTFNARGGLQGNGRTYDAFDQAITNSGVTYAYDALGRIATRNSTQFSYGDLGSDPIADGTSLRASHDPYGNPASTEFSTSRSISLQDAHGDLWASINPATGATASSRALDPWGTPTATTGTPSPLGYQSDWTDPTTKTVNMGARHYDSSLAGFLTRDSIDDGNRYAYAGGNPINNWDPDGHRRYCLLGICVGSDPPSTQLITTGPNNPCGQAQSHGYSCTPPAQVNNNHHDHNNSGNNSGNHSHGGSGSSGSGHSHGGSGGSGSGHSHGGSGGSGSGHSHGGSGGSGSGHSHGGSGGSGGAPSRPSSGPRPAPPAPPAPNGITAVNTTAAPVAAGAAPSTAVQAAAAPAVAGTAPKSPRVPYQIVATPGLVPPPKGSKCGWSVGGVADCVAKFGRWLGDGPNGAWNDNPLFGGKPPANPSAIESLIFQIPPADPNFVERLIYDRPPCDADGYCREHKYGVVVIPGFAGGRAPRSLAIAKYDPDFALGQITSGGQARASQLIDFAESQGWKRLQSQTGPIKYVDENGIERIVLKSGSPRTPGSADPHIAIRDAAGRRVDPYGNPVGRPSPGNHTSIEWDLP